MITPGGREGFVQRSDTSKIEKKDKEKEKGAETLTPRARSGSTTHLVSETSGRPVQGRAKRGDSFLKTAEQTKKGTEGILKESSFDHREQALVKLSMERKFYYQQPAHEKFNEAFDRMERVFQGIDENREIESKRKEKGKEKEKVGSEDRVVEKEKEKEKEVRFGGSPESLKKMKEAGAAFHALQTADPHLLEEGKSVTYLITQFPKDKDDDIDLNPEVSHLLSEANRLVESHVAGKEPLSALDVVKLRSFLDSVRRDDTYKAIDNKQFRREFDAIDKKLGQMEQKAIADLAPTVSKINTYLRVDLNDVESDDKNEVYEHTQNQIKLRHLMEPLNNAIDQKRETLVKDILSANKKEYKKLVDAFVKETNEDSLQLFGKFQSKAPEPDKLKEQLKEQRQSIEQRASALTLFAENALFDIDSAQDRKKVLQFFVDVSDQLRNKKHDFYSSAAIFGAVNSNNIGRTLVKGVGAQGKTIVDKEHVAKLKKLEDLYVQSGNIEKATAKEYKKKTYLPETAMIGRHLDKTSDAAALAKMENKTMESKPRTVEWLMAANKNGIKYQDVAPAKFSNLAPLEQERSADKLGNRSDELKANLQSE